MKLTDFGAAPPRAGMSKEDERSLEFAERAQRGDYDDGLTSQSTHTAYTSDLNRAYLGTTRSKPRIPHR